MERMRATSKSTLFLQLGGIALGINIVHDTAKFRLPGIRPPDHRITNRELGHVFKPYKNGEEWHVYFTDLEGPFETAIRVTYYPQDVYLNPIPLSLVECSLPKLIYGNNIEMLMEPREALKVLNLIISSFFERKIDLDQAELDRVDLCYNHEVGDFVLPLIAELYKLNYPRRATKPFYPTYGVQFYSKAAALIFYGKEEESGNKKAKGILKEEASYCTKFSVRRALGTKKPVFIGDFTPEIVESILQRENEKLGLNEAVMVDKTIALRTLLSQFGPEQGMRLFGYLNSVNMASNQELINLGIPSRTLYRNKKSIKDIGMVPALNDQNLRLPSLSVNLTKCHGVVSCSSDT